MMFVDGENLAKRYAALLGNASQKDHIIFERDVFVWSPFASRRSGPEDYIRRHYYTSAGGDAPRHRELEEQLRAAGIEAPHVFPRKQSRSKRVDITLATDMLHHAYRGNYDIAVLVAGDEDYVPLVEAVKSEGRRVALWFVSDGMSPSLRAVADHHWQMDELLFNDRHSEPAFIPLYG